MRARSPEGRLLLACVRSQVDPHALLALGSRRLDWRRLVTAAVQHGVAPLLHFHLRNLDVEIPHEAARSLKAAFYWAAAENRNLDRNLSELVDALCTAGVAVLVLKGAALATRVYPHPALRSMEDLDLLIREKDLDVADRVVRTVGYRSDDSFAPKDWYRRRHHHLAPYLSEDRRQTLELHHHIARFEVTGHIPVRDLWNRARTEVLGSTEALVLAPPDALLHVCLHLAYDNRLRGRLRDLCDVREILRRQGKEFDWEEFLRRARDYEIQKYLYYPLLLSKELTDAPVPELALAALRSAAPGGRFEKALFERVALVVVLNPPHSRAVMPDSFVNACMSEMLSGKGRFEKIGSLFAIASRGVGASAAKHVSRPRWLAVAYAVCVHPVVLLARALRRFAMNHRGGDQSQDA